MPLNTFNLSNSALSEFNPNTLSNFYPAGTLLITEDGTTFRALKVSTDSWGDPFQAFTMCHPNGMGGYTDSLPEDAKVIWFPTEEPAPAA